MDEILGNISLEGISIEVTEKKGIKTIEIINSENCNIVYNGKTILENIESKYSIIPVQIRDKVKEYSDFIELDKENNSTEFYMCIDGIEYYCTVDTIIVDEEKSFLKLNNWVNSYEKIAEYNDEINKDKYKKKLKELEEIAQNKGYSFIYSHDGDCYDVCYSLLVPVKGFDLDDLKTFLDLWNRYNNDLAEYIPK